MTAVVFNNHTKVRLDCEAALLHAACLLAGHTVAAGSTRQMLHHFQRKHDTFDKRLSYLDGCFRGHEGFEDVKRAIKLCKDYKKIKHPPGHLIAAYKGMQKWVEAEYKNQTADIFEAMDRHRVTGIDALAAHGYFEPCHLANQWPMPGERTATAVEIATLAPEATGSSIASFLLSIDLFSKDFPVCWPYSVDKALPVELESLHFLHSVFKVPSLILLSLDELHAARTEVKESATAFHQAMDEWTRLCQCPESDEDPVAFFKEKVLPAAESFQAALDGNAVLNQQQRAGNDKRQFLFGLGLMSPVALWELLRRAELLDDEDWTALQGLAADPQYHRPRPVMLLEAVMVDDEIEGDPPAVSLKKSILLDD